MGRHISLLLITTFLSYSVSVANAGGPQNAPQTAEEFLDTVKNNNHISRYYKKDERIVDFDIKTAIKNFDSHMHGCYDTTITTLLDHGGKMVDRYTSTLRWKGKDKVIFALQTKNLTGNQHHSKQVMEPKDGFFIAGADFVSTGTNQTKISLYYRGGFMSSVAKKLFTPIFSWSKGEKALCPTTRKKI